MIITSPLGMPSLPQSEVARLDARVPARSVPVGGGDPVAQSLLAWIAAEEHGLSSPTAVTAFLDEIRLEDLVLRLLDLDIGEARQLDVFADSDVPFGRSPERFFEALQQAIRQLRLSKLFARTRDGDYHRSICPAAYNERIGKHYPEEMARWRADFKERSFEQRVNS